MELLQQRIRTFVFLAQSDLAEFMLKEGSDGIYTNSVIKSQMQKLIKDVTDKHVKNVSPIK